jgi:hypothetical protein
MGYDVLFRYPLPDVTDTHSVRLADAVPRQASVLFFQICLAYPRRFATLVSMCCTRPHFASLSGQLTPALLRPLYCRLCDLVSLRWGNGQVTHLASSEEEEAALSLPRGGHLLGIRNRLSIWCIWRSDTCHLGKHDLANYGVVYRLEL